MGASRTPVREAMQKLETEDLVSKLPKGGYIVRSLTIQDIEEVFGNPECAGKPRRVFNHYQVD